MITNDLLVLGHIFVVGQIWFWLIYCCYISPMHENLKNWPIGVVFSVAATYCRHCSRTAVKIIDETTIQKLTKCQWNWKIWLQTRKYINTSVSFMQKCLSFQFKVVGSLRLQH